MCKETSLTSLDGMVQMMQMAHFNLCCALVVQITGRESENPGRDPQGLQKLSKAYQQEIFNVMFTDLTINLKPLAYKNDAVRQSLLRKNNKII